MAGASIDRDRRAEGSASAHGSDATRALLRDADVIDLHVDSFIWHRIAGYNLGEPHEGGPLGRHFAGHADLPRLCGAGFTGAAWVITTNPLRTAAGRTAALERNVARLSAALAAEPGVTIVRTAGEYRAARAAGHHAAFLAVQGGNALGADLGVLDRLPPKALLRVTLVHLTDSSLGHTSSPLRIGGDGGLTPFGRDAVEALERAHVFVDLAHASKRTFWDVVAHHDRARPLLVTHTGVDGVHRHWRNLDDEQLRAIADSGGVVGIMYHVDFLGPRRSRVNTSTVVDHIEHVIRTVGEDHVALGSDWDGAITTPADMPTAAEFPRLVDAMLARGFSEARVRKVLGENFLRCLAAVRP